MVVDLLEMVVNGVPVEHHRRGDLAAKFRHPQAGFAILGVRVFVAISIQADQRLRVGGRIKGLAKPVDEG